MFINGQTCCNLDSVVMDNSQCMAAYQSLMNNQYGYGLGYFQQAPFCPPIVVFQCYNLVDPFCYSVRRSGGEMSELAWPCLSQSSRSPLALPPPSDTGYRVRLLGPDSDGSVLELLGGGSAEGGIGGGQQRQEHEPDPVQREPRDPRAGLLRTRRVPI
jgi:hypothetical protein